MVGGAARNHVDAIYVVELLERETELVDVELTGGGHAADEGVAHDARLLVDLLEHEVGVAALLGHVEVPIDVGDLGLDDVALGIGVLDAVGGELGELVVGEDHDVAGGVDEGDDVGGDVGAALAAADDDGRVLAGDRDGARLVRADGREAIGADDAGAGGADGGHQVMLGRVGVLDEVREDLGVRVGAELVAGGRELLAELREVLDDPVVDDGDAAVAAHVRVRVGGGGAPVGGPAGVADAAGGALLIALEFGGEAGDLAHAADHVEAGLPVGAGDLERHARRVVASVLHARQALDEDLLRLVLAGESDDAAHTVVPFVGAVLCAREALGDWY